MVRTILSSALLLAFMQFANACPGQTGKVIFSDDFSDDSGGWELGSNTSVEKGALQFKFVPKDSRISDYSMNLSFNAFEGDYCAEFSFPNESADPNNPDIFAIFVLMADIRNRFSLGINSAGEASVTRAINNVSSYIVPDTKMSAIKTGPGAVNDLRIVFKEQKLTFFINGEKFKVVRTAVPDTATRFGLMGGLSNKAPPAVRTFLVKSFSVNENE